MTDSLVVDIYPGDPPCNWAAYIAAGPPWCGAIFKLTQGLDYEYATWAAKQRERFVYDSRYAVDLFDGFYHYLTFHQDGRLQAERFWGAMERVGGERTGTLWAMLDVERGGQRIANPSRELVEDRAGAWAARYEQLSGRRATLYGGELLRGVGVTSRLGCGRSAVALYGSRLGGPHEGTADFLRRTGTDLEHLMLWQYRGTEPQSAGPPGCPMTAPGCGEIDISALVLPGGLERLRSTLWAESPTP